MATITFEITKEKTIVTAIGLNGMIDKIDITKTEIEKDFTKLLKKIKDHQLATKIIDALDVNSWKED